MNIHRRPARGGWPVGPATDPTGLSEGRRTFRVGIYSLLLVLDCVAVLATFAIANLFRFGDPLAAPGTNSGIALLPIYLFIAADRKLYSGLFFTSWRRNAFDAARSFWAASLAVLFIGFYLHAGEDMSRIVMGVGMVTGTAWLIVQRGLVHHLALRMTNGQPITTLVIADGIDVDTTEDTIILDAAVLGLQPTASDPHDLDRFGTLVRPAERVIVACPLDKREGWAAMLKGANVQGEIVMPELAPLGTLRAAVFAGQPTLVVSLGPLDTRNRVLKRAFDLSVAIAVLLLIWPALVGIAIAVRIDSAGPILFRQQRMGRGNTLFMLYKFRSMRSDLCDTKGDVSTARGDARITRVGRIIRATSLDELPQMLNVLRGDMSIVGPRPHALGSLAGDKLFWEVDRRYWDRHAIKPGITGLAQVHGHRGATAQASDLEDRLKSDLAYMRDWTIWRDVRILLATTGVLFHRNAF